MQKEEFTFVDLFWEQVDSRKAFCWRVTPRIRIDSLPQVICIPTLP